MRRMWDDIKAHPISAALFLIYWLIVFGLDVFRWRKPANRPEDMVPAVIYLNFLLPVLAGALVSLWRRCTPGSVTSGMLAGAAVLVVDAAALLTHGFFAFRRWESGGEGWGGVFEFLAFLIGLGLIGSLLGWIGASGSAALARLLGCWHNPAAAWVWPSANERAAGGGEAAGKPPLGIVPRRVLRVAGGLALGAAIIVLFGVIPPIAAVGVARTAPGAVPAFAVNALLNVLIGIALLAPVSRRSAGTGRALAVMAGFLGLLLGLALLDAAAAALAADRLAMQVAAVACLAGAAGDLGAGVLALVAAFRRRGKDWDAALPAF